MDEKQVVKLTFEKLYTDQQDFKTLKFKRKTRSKSLPFSGFSFEEIGCGFSKRQKSLPFSIINSEENVNSNLKYSNGLQSQSLEKNGTETFYKSRIFQSNGHDSIKPFVTSQSIDTDVSKDNFNSPSSNIGNSVFDRSSVLSLLKCRIEEDPSNELYDNTASHINVKSLDKVNFIDHTFELLYRGQKTVEGFKFKRKRKFRTHHNDINSNSADILQVDKNQGSESFSANIPMRCEEDSETDSNKSGIIPVTHRKKLSSSPDKEIIRKREFNQQLKIRRTSKREGSRRDSDNQKNSSYHTSSHENAENCSRDRSKHRKRYKYNRYKEKRNHRNYSQISKSNEGNLHVPDGKITNSHEYYRERHRSKKQKTVGHYREESADGKGSYHKISKTEHKLKHKKCDIKTKTSTNDFHEKLNSNRSKNFKSKSNRKRNENVKLDKTEIEDVESYKESQVDKSVYRNYRSDKHMKTRGLAKIIVEKQRREKELTTINHKLQDEILHRHELDIGSSNNGYDCLDVLDERVNLICDDEIALPISNATQWSNGERQYNLTINNQSDKVLHNGGIWKSITREKL